MDYNTAVREKMTRMMEEPIVPPILNAIMNRHDFQQSCIEQESFEPRKFLFYKYNKKVRTLKEPTGLCLVCRKLEVEHKSFIYHVSN